MYVKALIKNSLIARPGSDPKRPASVPGSLRRSVSVPTRSTSGGHRPPGTSQNPPGMVRCQCHRPAVSTAQRSWKAGNATLTYYLLLLISILVISDLDCF